MAVSVGGSPDQVGKDGDSVGDGVGAGGLEFPIRVGVLAKPIDRMCTWCHAAGSCDPSVTLRVYAHVMQELTPAVAASFTGAVEDDPGRFGAIV
jgi:hypothetical protein